MPVTSNTQETKLAYRVDARGLRDLKKEVGSIKDSLKGLASEQMKLTKLLLGVEEGTEAYKALEKQLDTTEGKARRLRAALRAVNEEHDAHHRKQGAFTQGLLQGLTPALGQFIQRDPGMQRQFAGQAIGAGVRGMATRAGMAAGAMVGGTGPLTALMGNIPFLGGAAQAAEQQAQAAVGFSRTRFDALPFLGGFGVRRGSTTVTPGTEATPDRFVRSYDGETQSQRQKAVLEAARRVDKIAREAGATREQAQGPRDAAIRRAYERSGGTVIPGSPGTPETRTRTPDGLAPWMAAGNRAFLSRQQTMEAAGQFGRIAGNNVGGFEQTEAARVLFGVERGVGASVFGQQRRGRGGSSDLGEGVLARSISDALAQGLEGGEISEYLERLVTLQESASQQGLKINTEAFGGMARTLGGMGLAGPQAARVASEFQSFGARVGGSGARGPMDIQLLRALGFNPEEGGDSYIDALTKAEKIGGGGMDANTLFDLVSNLTQGGGSTKRAGFSLQRALGSAGVKLSLEQAMGMTEAVGGGKEGFAERLRAAGLGDVDAGGRFSFDGMGKGDLTKALSREDVQEWGATVKAQAAIDDKLLAAGQTALPEIMKLQRSAADLAKAVATLSQTNVVSTMTDGIVQISGLLADLVEELRNRGGKL